MQEDGKQETNKRGRIDNNKKSNTALTGKDFLLWSKAMFKMRMRWVEMIFIIIISHSQGLVITFCASMSQKQDFEIFVSLSLIPLSLLCGSTEMRRYMKRGGLIEWAVVYMRGWANHEFMLLSFTSTSAVSEWISTPIQWITFFSSTWSPFFPLHSLNARERERERRAHDPSIISRCRRWWWLWWCFTCCTILFRHT